MLIPLSLLPGWIEPDRLGARADLGHGGGPPLGARGRRPRAAAPLPRAEPRVHGAFDAASASLRAPRARPRDPLADMRTWLRIFFIGGAISFRALFSWIRPSVYIPTLLIGPTTQILFFAYLGRTAHLESDSWFVVGNAVQSASLAALFGMGFAIDGERWTQTLSAVLATPANRAALFLGRALPVLVNAAVTAATGFIGGALLLGFRMPWSSVPAMAAPAPARVIRVHRPRHADGGSRPAHARRADHRQPDDGRAADLLRRQRAARQAARLDARDRQGAADDARDRSGAQGRRRRVARERAAGGARRARPRLDLPRRRASRCLRWFEHEGRRHGTLDRA